MAGKKGTKNISEKEFDSVKLMQKAKLSKNQIAKITDRGWSSVDHMFQADTWKDFLEQRKARHDAIRLRRNGNTVLLEDNVPAPSELRGGVDKPLPTTPMLIDINNNLNQLINDFGTLMVAVNSLLEAEDRRQASEKVAGWKFGRSR